MKRAILTLAASLLAMFTLSAQTGEYELPKFEFQITGGGGISTVLYEVRDDGIWTQAFNKVDGYHSAPLYQTTDDGQGHFTSMRPLAVGTSSFNNFGWNAGIGLAWHFHPNLGLLTGAELSFYKGSVNVEQLTSAQYIEQFRNPDYTGTTAYTMAGPAIIFNRLYNFTETQKLMYLQIPVMLKFMIPLGAQKANHLYLAAGAKLGIGLSGKFHQNADHVYFMYQDGLNYPTHTANSGWVLTDNLDHDNVFFYGEDREALRNAVMGQNPDAAKISPKWDYEGAMKLGINVLASVELGFRWRLSDALGLYTGAFLDYGLLNPVAASDKAVYQNDPIWNDDDQFFMGLNDYRIWGKDTGVSVLEAAQPASWRGDEEPSPTGSGTPILNNRKLYKEEGRFIEKANTFAAGLKIRLAFGKSKKKAPEAPQIVYVDRVVRDTVVQNNTVVVRDTVTNTVVEKVVEQVIVRDTVTIIKEVPVEIQKTMADLSNTMFDFNKSEIKEAAKGPLNTVVAWLQENPNVKVEISGHTDNKGSAAYNQRLSEARAKAVYDYFVSQGVDKFRLAYAGYGMDKPIATNATEEGRQRNRRVELNIVE
ncbi:MAG: OmpA family protein [Bacteroidales bacterium]|nr:OmpA family protein [Bacteroidales bacterium]